MSVNLSDEELERIGARLREWPWKDPLGLFEFLRAHWAYADWGFHMEPVKDDEFTDDGIRFRISTAGWSDNESLIDDLQRNCMFWTIFWLSHRRGGHYEFHVSDAFMKSVREAAEVKT